MENQKKEEAEKIDGTAEQQEKTKPFIPDPSVTRYLTPENATFSVSEGLVLSVTVDGVLYEKVLLHASFPHSCADEYIAVRDPDGKEVGMIRALTDFPEKTQEIFRRQISIRYFAPEITRILSLKEEFGYTYWVTETTSGECRFTVRNGGGSIIHPTPEKYLIVDVDGNRFVIRDINKLPPKDYKLIDIYL